MSSKPRRLAVLAVATTLAAGTGTAQATTTTASAPAKPSAQWVVVPETAAAAPPANVTALARSLGVDTAFAWRTLDELAQTPARKTASSKAAPATPHHAPTRSPR
jgi:hypothetical protein